MHINSGRLAKNAINCIKMCFFPIKTQKNTGLDVGISPRHTPGIGYSNIRNHGLWAVANEILITDTALTDRTQYLWEQACWQMLTDVQNQC